MLEVLPRVLLARNQGGLQEMKLYFSAENAERKCLIKKWFPDLVKEE